MGDNNLFRKEEGLFGSIELIFILNLFDIISPILNWFDFSYF